MHRLVTAFARSFTMESNMASHFLDAETFSATWSESKVTDPFPLPSTSLHWLSQSMKDFSYASAS